MRRLAACIILMGGVLATIVRPVRAEITPQQITEAIDRAVDYLERQQRRDGTWPVSSRLARPDGVTALCMLAMLNAGVEADDEHIQRGLNYLRKLRPDEVNHTYTVSLQTMVFCKADPKRDRSLITRNVAWLQRTQIKDPPSKGAWGYPGMSGDNSNSQFALLALYEAERAGVPVDGRTWGLARNYWEGVQNPDGSWGYRRGMPGSGSMTCAGIAALVITSGKARQNDDAQVAGGRIQCCMQGESDQDRLQNGLQWLGKNFAVTHNPADPENWLLYYLYGVERVGRLTAQRFIGRHDWYREGADHLMKMRGAFADHWKGVGHAENDERIATSLALLFLSKGRRPTLLAKLKHSSDNDWNQHRSDVDNLTRYVESRWPRDLSWQVVDLRAATIEDLLQSPVLYYCGRKSPFPAAAAEQEALARKLRGYIDRGGFLFAEAYSQGSEFDRGFRQLIERVFREPEYRLHLLPREHPVWRTEEPVAAGQMRPLWGIEFGCRTSVIYCPPDTDPAGGARPSLSCLWELSRPSRDLKYAEAVQQQVDAGLSIGINVLAYATNRELKYKYEMPRNLAEKSGDRFPRGRVFVASLRHPGGCHAAPRALINLLETAADKLKIRVGAERREINITDAALFDYHLLFMHGRNAFHLTDGERKQLRAYIERGGMLLANAICANPAFAESFRREMGLIFPDNRLEQIPGNDPLLTPAYGGFDLSTVTRRDPQRATGDEPLEDILRRVPPELEGIRFDDRWGVVFSPYDLSCALEKHNSLECQGYVREDAARIGLNVLLYSLQQ